MKRKSLILLAALATLGLVAGCQDQKTPQAQAPAAVAPAAPAAAPAQPAAASSGKVVETMNAGGYTYVQVDTGKEKIWAAAPQFAVKVGDAVVVPSGLPMTKYESKSLGRTFDLVYFVDGILVGGAQPVAATPATNTQPAAMPGAKMPGGQPAAPAGGMPPGHPPITSNAAPEIDFSGLKKADGGKTVGEVFAGKGQLAGKQVVLRGKVVKFSPQIMGKNWIHLQDGTGGNGTNDLTVTTEATAKVGDTVMVTGVLAADKDFGYGYKYPVIVENAKVVVE